MQVHGAAVIIKLSFSAAVFYDGVTGFSSYLNRLSSSRSLAWGQLELSIRYPVKGVAIIDVCFYVKELVELL